MRITLKAYFETDPDRKTGEWGDTIVTHLRRYMQNLVNPNRYWKNMELLMDTHDMDEVRKLFLTPDDSGASFISLSVFEKIRNVIIAENENAGIQIHLRAVDPTATNQKQLDRELLANRKPIESMMSFMQQSIGGPPFSLKNEKNEKGKPLFAGNVEDFDRMGLDDNSDEDLDYFFSTYHRLRHEIKGEEPINFFVAYNELPEQVALYINDILASKRVAARAYVNEITGAIDYKYVCPAHVKWIPGKRRDGKDAAAISIDQDMTVADFIKLVGNDFNYETDLDLLLNAANAHNGTSYSGVRNDGEDGSLYLYVGNHFGELCSYGDFLEFSVGVGYIEWKSIDASWQRETERNSLGNPSILAAKPDRKMSPNSIYQLVTRYWETTYKSYYLITGDNTQKLYKYGKLSYQAVEGVEDEYSSFSIIVYQEKGKPAVQVALPYIRMIQKAWAKFEHMVAAAKPPGRGYNYDSLVKIAEHMFPEAGVDIGIDNVLKMFYDGSNEIYTIPTTEEGKPVGGGNMSSYLIENGLPKGVLDFKTILDYAFDQINDKLGISNLRDAGSQDPREGYKMSMQALQYSHNATQYVRSMMISLFNNIGKCTLSYVQDIIRFRDKNSLPYKFMVKALGDDTMKDMESLFDVPFHRYGIFVEALNTQYERESIKAMATQAMINKEISYEQLLLITSVSSPKRAAMILAYEKKRKERMDVKAADVAHQQAMELKKADTAEKVQMTQAEYAGEASLEHIKGGYMVQVARIQAGAEVAKQNMKNESKPGEIENRKNADMEKDQAKMDMQAQQPLVSA